MAKTFSGINWGTNAPISYNDTQYNVELAFTAFGTYTVEVYDQNLINKCSNNYDCELFKEINNNINSLLKEYSKVYSTISKMHQSLNEFYGMYASKYSNSKYKLDVHIDSIRLTDESSNIVKNIKEGVSNSNTQSNSSNTSNSNTTTSNSSSNETSTTTSNTSNTTSQIQQDSSNNNGKNSNSNNIFIIGGIVLVVIALVVVLFSKSKKNN